MMPRPSLVAMLIAIVLGTAACLPDGFVFIADERVSITAPDDREEVEVPVTVRWDVDPELAADIADPTEGPAGFGVVLDQHPQPPGQTIGWFARDDDGCTMESKCPDLRYLAERGVYTTRTNSITFAVVPPNPVGNERQHEVTIFLIDAAGTRLSESTWSVEFRTPKELAR